MDNNYSKSAGLAFLFLFGAYLLLLSVLWLLQARGIVTFQQELNGDILSLLRSLPFAAFYLLVLIAATAGYARGAVMAKELPLFTMLKSDLQRKNMVQVSLSNAIRSGGELQEEQSLLCAVNGLLASRIPILPVMDSEKKFTRVITSQDVLRKLQEVLLKKNEADDLGKRLEAITLKDLVPAREPVSVKASDPLYTVLGRMVNTNLTKLVVVDDQDNKQFVGTVDALDIMAVVYAAMEQEK